MSNQAKMIRGQIRQVVQEMLPELLSKEVAQAIEARIVNAMIQKLTKIENNVRETLQAVDQRSKDSLSYLIRNASTPVSAPTEQLLAPKDYPAVQDSE